jgi:hypothetical protein
VVQASIQIHDRFQFELKIGYTILKDDRKTHYRIEIYFFIPASLDVNKHTYSKHDFYNDLQSYIRFKSPTLLLRQLPAEGPDSPLQRLRESFEQLLRRQDDVAAANYVRQIKMFSCIVKGALKDHVALLSRQNSENGIDTLIAEYLRIVPNLAAQYRSLKATIDVPSIPSMLYSTYAFGDEYLSLMVEESAFLIMSFLRKRQDPRFREYLEQLHRIIQAETEHRAKICEGSIAKEGDDNEELVFRKSVLKKFMSSVLYLRTTTEKEGLLLEQLLFALAAGLSMLFTTAVVFYSQVRYGSIGFTIFLIIVISYMFKDRVKELLRTYFASKVQRSLFDTRINLFTAEKESIGWVKRVFYFTKERHLPSNISLIRNRDHITEIENSWMGEKIAVYAEKVNIFSKKLIGLYKDYTMEGINNIMRVDISKFLRKMDNPKKPLFVLTEQGHKVTSGQRVYHLNLIIKFASPFETSYKRFRVVMNRDGMKRIEEV